MAESLECAPDYLERFRTGTRKTEHIGQEFAERAAAYLGVPAALVKVIAGRLTARDFAWPQRTLEQENTACLEALRDDPVVGCYFPDELHKAAPQVKEFVWRLYTECAELHPHQLRILPRTLEYLQRAALNETEFEAELAELRKAMEHPVSQDIN